MIRKLRRKFVCINMLMVTAILLVVFFSVYSSSRAATEENSMAVLHRVIMMDGGPSRPGSNKEEVQLPYFTVRIFSDNTVYLVNGGYFEFKSADELSDIVTACLAEDADSGVIQAYNLRYLREKNLFEEKIAFVDISMEQSTLKSLLLNSLQIALVSLVLLLLLSIALARWAVRPVENSLRQQHQFLSDASHELKTPLTVILSNVSLLQEELGDGTENQRRWLDNVDSESRRMKTLVDEMLTLARSENPNRPALPHAEVNLSDAVTDESLLFEPTAFEAGKPLQEDIAEGVFVSGSTEQLKQVLSILLDNAVKYGSDGEEILVALRREGKKALLSVRNAAPDIPPDKLAHLFDRFYRADDSRGETSGFGLGLSIAASIVREHGGTLRAESAEETVTFVVSLPLKS